MEPQKTTNNSLEQKEQNWMHLSTDFKIHNTAIKNAWYQDKKKKTDIQTNGT